MPTLVRGIGESLTAMQHSKVVDKVNVTGLSSNLELEHLGRRLNGIESLTLAGRHLRQRLGPWVARAAQQSSSSKVGNQFAAVVVNDGSALKLGTVVVRVSSC